MDRRAALKKLGAGSALAGAALVIPSFDVAYAASGSITPPAPSNSWITWQTNRFQIVLPVTGLACSGSGTATPSVVWQIQSFDIVDFVNARTLRLHNGLSGSVFSSATAVPFGGAASGSATAGPTTIGVSLTPTPGDLNVGSTATFTITALVTWLCGSEPAGSRTYTFTKAFWGGTSVS